MATNVWGIAMVRDEADIIATTVRHMLGHVDHVLVANNLSTDATAELAAAAGAQVVDDPDPAYEQADKMTALATSAWQCGAEWVVPFDADEIWTTRDGQRIADYLHGLDADVAIAQLFDHRITDADDADETDPVVRMRWREQAPAVLPKMAARTDATLTLAMGNHDVGYERAHRRVHSPLMIHHYPYRSPEQFIRKSRNGAAALAATKLHRSIGAHWRMYGRLTDDELTAHYFQHFHKPTADLVEDPPW